MTTITALRHGETEWNRIGRQQGRMNSSLSALGVEQARRAARRLVREPHDIIYCSALGRAAETAAIIARETGVETMQDSGLNERHLGILQGLTLEEFREAFPAEHDRFISGDPDYIIPGGESARQRYERTIAAATAIIAENPGKKIVMVVHGGNLDSFFRFTLGIPLERPRCFSLMNAGINTFTVDNGAWKLVSWGDISHLRDIKALDDF